MKNRGVWFVVGFGFGFLALYVAIATVPHLGPAMVKAESVRVETIDQQSLSELGRLARRVNRRLDEEGATSSALSSDLQTIRSQIELYKVQHNERHPGLDEDGKLDMANFTRRLTGRTDQSGRLNHSGAFGPYLQRFPVNPFMSGDHASEVTYGKVDPGAGWYFNTTSGDFFANDPGHVDW